MSVSDRQAASDGKPARAAPTPGVAAGAMAGSRAGADAGARAGAGLDERRGGWTRGGWAGGRLLGRRSLGPALLLLGAGVAAALLGAGRSWATVHATSKVPQLGVDWTATAGVSGNDVAPLSALALLAAVFAVGIAATRGRGRWPVGAGLLAFGLGMAALAASAGQDGANLRDRALELAIAGRLEELPAGASLQVDTSLLGPALVVAGGALVALAGLLTIAAGRTWPALGDRYRAPGDARTPPEPSDPH